MEDYTGSLSTLNQDLAIEAWINPVTNPMDDAQVLFVYNKPGATEKDTLQYMLGINNGIPFAGKGDVVDVATREVPVDEGWVHLAASYCTMFGIQLGGSRYMDAVDRWSFRIGH